MGLFNRKTATIYFNGRNILVSNKKEAEFYAQQFLKHCYESADIVNHTKNPQVFFERYSFLISETENLAQLEIFLKFKGTQPSQQLATLKENKENETNLMIGRACEDLGIKLNKLKTAKGKTNAINKLFDLFMIYSDRMTKSNIDLCTSYYNTFTSNLTEDK